MRSLAMPTLVVCCLVALGCSEGDTDYFLYALFSKEDSIQVFYLSTIDKDDPSPTEMPFGRGLEGARPTWNAYADTVMRRLQVVETGNGFYQIVDTEKFLSTKPVSVMHLHVGNDITEVVDFVGRLTSTNLTNTMPILVSDSDSVNYLGSLVLAWTPVENAYIYRCAAYDPVTSDSVVFFTFDTSLNLPVTIPKGQQSRVMRLSIMACSNIMKHLSSMGGFSCQGDSTVLEYLSEFLQLPYNRRRLRWYKEHTSFSTVTGTYSEQSRIVEIRR